MPRVLLPLVAVSALVTALVIGSEAATAVSGDLPDAPPGASVVCSFDVAGRLADRDIGTAPTPTARHEYVRWSADTGFSVQVHCVGKIDTAYASVPLDSVSLVTGGSSPDSRRMERFVPAPVGPGFQAGPTNHGWRCRAVDGDLSKGFGAYCGAWDAPAGRMQWLRPLMTRYERLNEFVDMAMRFDFEPHDGPIGHLPDGCGTAGWTCPSGGSTLYFPRTGFAIAVNAYTGGAGFGANLVGTPNDTGGSMPLPHPTPPYVMPPMSPPGGGCRITGWTLKNTVDGRQWTQDSPDRYAIVMTNTHAHTLVVRFTGQPSTIRVQVRREAQTLQSAQAFSPRPPTATFSLRGTGQRVQLSISCIGADGDIPPPGQTVVTDEDENPKTSLAECLGDAEFELTSPGTWVRGLVHGVGCLFSWAFIPTKPISERFYEVRSSSEAASSAAGVVAGLGTGFTTLSSSAPGQCEGPTINVPQAGLTNQQPFNACDNWLGDAAAVVRRVLLGVIVLGTVSKMWRILQSVINGDSVTVYQAEFNSDTSSGGTWS